jgi:WD40 repeat protein
MHHRGPISGISSLEDRYIATAGYDNQIILWDAKTATPLHRVHHDHLANQCAFNNAGNLLVSASSDHTARIWHVPSLRLKAALVGHLDDVEMAMFSPDGETVATCSRDHTLRLFDLSGRVRFILEGHSADVISVSWAADGRTLVSSSDDGTIRRWCANTGSAIDVVDLNGIETDTVAISSEGIIFAGDDAGVISVITPSGIHLEAAHSAGIKRLVWDDARRLLVTLSYDRSVVLWYFDTDRALSRRAHSVLPSIVWPRSCAFLGTDRIAFVTFGSRYATWNFESGQWDTASVQPTYGLNAVAVIDRDVFSVGDGGTVWKNGLVCMQLGSLCNFLLPIGHTVLTGGQTGEVFDAVSGEVIHQHRSPLNCACLFKRDGVIHAAIGTYTGEALIFVLGEGHVRFVETVQMHGNAIKGISASADSLFSVCATAAVAFHRISDFRLEQLIEKAHDRISNGCVAIPNGFASIGRDLKLRLWRKDANEVYDTPHESSIKCIALAENQRYLATGSYGGVIAIFDLVRQAWISVQKPTCSGISCLTPDNENDGFLASSYDGNTYEISVQASLRSTPSTTCTGI